MNIGPELWNVLASTLKGSVAASAVQGPPDFEYLSTDTRTLHGSKAALSHTVFLALRGPRHDGHAHVAAAAASGVRGFILASDWPGEDPDGHVLRVPNTLMALQALGRAARQSRPGKVVGITGSNGKTMVKEWAHALAPATHRVSRSPGSWNSQVGVPLSLWGMDDTADSYLVEAGISMPGEMETLASIIAPNIGVMVHFGDAHGSHFSSRQAKAQEKVRLFKDCDKVILGTHDPDVIQALTDHGVAQRCIYWTLPHAASPALPGTCALNITKADRKPHHTHLVGTWKGKPLEWTVPFTDEASLSNALTAALIMLELSGDLAAVTSNLPLLQPLGMRLEHLTGTGGGTIINDTWNHDLDGLSTALEALDRLSGDRKNAVVLSDLVLFDRQDPEQIKRLKHTLGQHQVDHWIAVGPQLSEGIPGVTTGTVDHFDSTEELLNSASLDRLQGWDVLVKGARPFAFERVSRALEANPHTTVFDLDLGRLAHNLEQHRERFGLPIMGMVKAFAYGAGDAVAIELSRLGITRLAVAFTEEGVALRKAGVQCPIMVLNADPQRFHDLIEWRLEPEVHHLGTIEQWGRVRANHAAIEEGENGVHLKVETGMHRLGLAPEEAHLAGAKCAELGIPIISVYSHLSAADDVDADAHTRLQIEAYDAACQAVSQGWASTSDRPEGSGFIRHLANTAGAARFPDARYDMVRIGLGLYGLDASGTMKNLQPIGRFHTRISHLHDVTAGTPVGYGAKDSARHTRRIATLPVGYADGLPRSAGMGKVHLFTGGKLCPTVGPVCMDGCMIDVTGMEVRVGDPVEIFGDHATIEDLASATGTIPYEILCRIPQRVRRRHLRT